MSKDKSFAADFLCWVRTSSGVPRWPRSLPKRPASTYRWTSGRQRFCCRLFVLGRRHRSLTPFPSDRHQRTEHKESARILLLVPKSFMKLLRYWKAYTSKPMKPANSSRHIGWFVPIVIPLWLLHPCMVQRMLHCMMCVRIWFTNEARLQSWENTAVFPNLYDWTILAYKID